MSLVDDSIVGERLRREDLGCSLCTRDGNSTKSGEDTMPLEDDRNYYIGGNLVVVRDTETQERYEVYLHRVPGRDSTESLLAHVEAMGPGQVIGRVDAMLNLSHSMWRCWVHQVVTPRFSAMSRPIVESVGNISMLDHSGALACDMVEAYRFHVLGRTPESRLEAQPVTRVSRYEREPVI